MKNIIFDFEYLAPKTLEEALTMLSQYNEEERKVIAGGQSLLILMRQKLITPQYLIDIKGLSDLEYIKFDKKEGLKIGALTIHRAVELSPIIQKEFSVLSEMEQNLSNVETRNWGTIGGDIAHADPCGDPAVVLIALNARLKLNGPSGERTMDAEDFTVDFFETALQPGELLTEIQVPVLPPNTGVKFTKYNQISGDLGLASVAMSITLDKDKKTCSDVRIALGGVAPAPIRAKKAEDILKGKKISDALLAEAGQAASEEASPTTDIQATDEYRRELVKVLVKRVGVEALARAKKA
ncbi:MAG: xanthine dehydrogenase family protein subunit M [Deltaproteobacteria bacterium]|nr:xanthine dehydrogenase family protein subunit M [Deltaproteobacteria bacterium]